MASSAVWVVHDNKRWQLFCQMLHADYTAHLYKITLVANSKAILLWVDSQAVAWNTLCLQAFCDLVTQVAWLVYAKLPVLSARYD